jgi:carbonic anhydrase
VVMGHAGAAGWVLSRAAKPTPVIPLSPGDFIGKWISLIKPAVARIAPAGAPPHGSIEQLALASIVQGLANLRTLSLDRGARAAGQARPSRSLFRDLRRLLLAFDEVGGRFEPVAAGAHRAAFARPGS